MDDQWTIRHMFGFYIWLQYIRTCTVLYTALQMKGRWEFNINFWFPFINSQKWNCAASLFSKQNYIVLSPNVYTRISIERYIYFQDRSAYSAAGKYVDRSWEYINRSQTHECGNWDWGRAVPRKGIHKWDFRCSVYSEQRDSSAFTAHGRFDRHTVFESNYGFWLKRKGERVLEEDDQAMSETTKLILLDSLLYKRCVSAQSWNF